MRLLLIANVRAQTVTPRRATVIERALASDFDVDLVHTTHRGHATELARDAAKFDLVVAMGGDGTVNEVANGLAGSRTPLAIIPGGGANVFARSLGMPEDPIEATGHVLAIRDRAPRRVTLGRAEDRYFLFSCGLGLDGAIVRTLERRRNLRRAMGQASYLWSGLTSYWFRFERRTPRVSVRWGTELEHRRDGLFLAICQNADPYTYLGDRPMRVCPGAGLDIGLDVLALDRAGLWFLLRTVARSFGRGRHARSRHALSLHDQERIELLAEVAMPAQMDGEYVGERSRLLLEAVPGALSVLA